MTAALDTLTVHADPDPRTQPLEWAWHQEPDNTRPIGIGELLAGPYNAVGVYWLHRKGRVTTADYAEWRRRYVQPRPTQAEHDAFLARMAADKQAKAAGTFYTGDSLSTHYADLMTYREESHASHANGAHGMYWLGEE